MHRIDTLNVQGSSMEVFVFEPEGEGPHPAIVLAQHLPVAHAGIETDEFTLRTARRFADAGYVVAVPFIFHWWPKEEEMAVKRDAFRDDWTEADLKATMDHLTALDTVDGDRVGIVGHCWGGRVAWLGACSDSRYSACVVFYGGRIKVGLGEGATPPVERATAIPCKVLGIFGNEDSSPSPQDVDDYEAALKAAGVPYVFHRYDGAGHAFQNFLSDERYRHSQSEDAWQKALDFLGEELARTS